MSRIVMLVPRRSDGGIRDESWAWIRRHWARSLPEVEIFEGTHDDGGPFNRSAAINAAAAEAGAWDVAVIADADSFVGRELAVAAINKAALSGLFVIGHSRLNHLTEEGSAKIIGGWQGNWEPLIRFSMYDGCSSFVAVARDVWDAVGGFDEGFVGWGEEDIAFSLACQTLAPRRGGRSSGVVRMTGDCWHLWHPVQDTNDPDAEGYLANVERRQRYVEAAGRPAVMAALIEELRG